MKTRSPPWTTSGLAHRKRREHEEEHRPRRAAAGSRPRAQPSRTGAPPRAPRAAPARPRANRATGATGCASPANPAAAPGRPRSGTRANRPSTRPAVTRARFVLESCDSACACGQCMRPSFPAREPYPRPAGRPGSRTVVGGIRGLCVALPRARAPGERVRSAARRCVDSEAEPGSAATRIRPPARRPTASGSMKHGHPARIAFALAAGLDRVAARPPFPSPPDASGPQSRACRNHSPRHRARRATRRPGARRGSARTRIGAPPYRDRLARRLHPNRPSPYGGATTTLGTGWYPCGRQNDVALEPPSVT